MRYDENDKDKSIHHLVNLEYFLDLRFELFTVKSYCKETCILNIVPQILLLHIFCSLFVPIFLLSFLKIVEYHQGVMSRSEVFKPDHLSYTAATVYHNSLVAAMT